MPVLVCGSITPQCPPGSAECSSRSVHARWASNFIPLVDHAARLTVREHRPQNLIDITYNREPQRPERRYFHPWYSSPDANNEQILNGLHAGPAKPLFTHFYRERISFLPCRPCSSYVNFPITTPQRYDSTLPIRKSMRVRGFYNPGVSGGTRSSNYKSMY